MIAEVPYLERATGALWAIVAVIVPDCPGPDAPPEAWAEWGRKVWDAIRAEPQRRTWRGEMAVPGDEWQVETADGTAEGNRYCVRTPYGDRVPLEGRNR